jgi:hypothetical protein
VRSRVTALTGNQDIGSFQSLANIGGTQYILGSQRVVGAQPTTIANPDGKKRANSILE